MPVRKRIKMIGALEALERLQVGNRRFVEGRQSHRELIKYDQGVLPADQSPFAIIIGCSDARVPAEIVFDQGVGDLFVIRVAGNIVAPSQVGSVEFAAERFGTGLVVVLGHSLCGAVQATLEELDRPGDSRSPNLHSIVDRIRPSVEGLLAMDLDEDALLRAAVRSNIRSSVRQLHHGSRILEQLIVDNSLHIVGAEYSLATSVVEFFDGLE
ncbi:MAG: carbonic anhydrase [Pseudomonadales bacterium]